MSNGESVSRINWGVFIAVAVNLLAVAYLAGGLETKIEDHEERISEIEGRERDDHDRLIRIEDAVNILVKEADKDERDYR